MKSLQPLFCALFCAIPAFATVTVTSPTSGSTVTSPVSYVATATTSTCSKGVGSMGIYVNNKLTYVVNGARMNTTLTLAPGSYSTVVEEWDHCGGATYTKVPITVKSGSGGGSTAVTVTTPLPNGTVTSPVSYVASATSSCAKGVASMGIYVNNKLIYTVQGASLNTSITLATGAQHTVVEEWDKCGGAANTTVNLMVTTATNTLKSIAVTPPNPSIVAGTTQQFAATATYSDGSTADITSTATWMAANTGVATIAAGGLATGVAAGSTSVTATLSGITGSDTLTVTQGSKTLKSIAVTPSNPSIAVSATQQFTATGTYSDNSTADITSTATWMTANTAVATIGSGGLATAVGAGSTQVTATLNSVTGTDSLTVTQSSPSGVSVTTWHFDNLRSGLNNQETTLSLGNVAPKTFGKLFSYLTDGYAYAEPLVMSNVTINGAVHNVVYVATEHDSVYAFDTDNYGAGAPLWQVSLLRAGETPVTAGRIQPFQGVTSTPVIDAASNTIYVVSAQRSSATGSTFRLNALDIATGAQKFNGPVTIQASVPGTNATNVNGIVSLPGSCIQRAALLLANGNIYIGFGHCHSGWLLAYDAHTLAQIGVFNASPNLDGEGRYPGAGGIWMGGGGPVADDAGNVYVSTGDGPWDGTSAYGDSILKFSPTLQLQDYFTSKDYQFLNCHDADLAAGGLMLIPGSSIVMGGGKGGKLYLVNTANLGKEQANDAGAVQALLVESDLSAPYSATCTDASGSHTAQLNSYEINATAAYYNGSVYIGVSPTTSTAPAGVRQFIYSGTLTYGAEAKPSIQNGTPGTTPFISSDGTANGILWMIDAGIPLQQSTTPTRATLRAYDANDLGTELYDSSQNAADVPGYGIKFTSPVVANGKVFISTGNDLTTVTNPQGELDIYGLK